MSLDLVAGRFASQGAMSCELQIASCMYISAVREMF